MKAKGPQAQLFGNQLWKLLKKILVLGSHSRLLGSEFLSGNPSCNVLNGFLKIATLTKKTYRLIDINKGHVPM